MMLQIWTTLPREVPSRPQVEAAKKAFQSALAGRTREVTSAAAIGISWCELFDGKDEAARDALADSRGASREDLAHRRVGGVVVAAVANPQLSGAAVPPGGVQVLAVHGDR